jgi:hypothetical protein
VRAEVYLEVVAEMTTRAKTAANALRTLWRGLRVRKSAPAVAWGTPPFEPHESP